MKENCNFQYIAVIAAVCLQNVKLVNKQAQGKRGSHAAGIGYDIRYSLSRIICDRLKL